MGDVVGGMENVVNPKSEYEHGYLMPMAIYSKPLLMMPSTHKSIHILVKANFQFLIFSS